MAKAQWPEWWSWEIELTPHLLKRMVDRSFTEVHLRRMLEVAATFAGYRGGTFHRGNPPRGSNVAHHRRARRSGQTAGRHYRLPR